jgi:uncharacterized membrane protein
MAPTGNLGVDCGRFQVAESPAKSVESPQGVEPVDLPVATAVAPLHHDPYDASWKERLLVLGTGFGLLLAGLILGLRYAHDSTVELVGLIPVSNMAVGKFLPLWGITGQSNFSPFELGLVIWVIDTYTVLFIVYGLEGLYRFAYLKRAIDRVRSNASLVLAAYPRMRKGAVLGVGLFVLFPIAGTGAMMGAFLGILLGLHRHIVIMAVSAGGLLGGMIMAFLAVYFGGALMSLREMQQHAFVKYGSIAFMVVLTLLALRWLSRSYKRALAAAKAQGVGAGQVD